MPGYLMGQNASFGDGAPESREQEETEDLRPDRWEGPPGPRHDPRRLISAKPGARTAAAAVGVRRLPAVAANQRLRTAIH